MDTTGTIGNYKFVLHKKVSFYFSGIANDYAALTIMDNWAARVCISMGEKIDKRCYSIDQILLIGKNMRLKYMGFTATGWLLTY